MLGCDYCESIRGVGPKRAVELIEQYKSIEEIIKNIDTKKYQVPEDWNYQQARKLFIDPEVADPNEIDVNYMNFDLSLVKLIIEFHFIRFFCS